MSQRQHFGCSTGARLSRARARLAIRADIDFSLYKVPVWASNAPRLPMGTGRLRIYEPRFLAMFKDVAERGGEMRFAHVLSGKDTPASIERTTCGALAKVGVLAKVTALQVAEDGTLLVDYEGQRRLSVLSVQQTEPYLEALVCNFHDRGVAGSLTAYEQQVVDDLELGLYFSLRELLKLTQRMDGPGERSGLPESVVRYAPPAAPGASSASSLSEGLMQHPHFSAAGHAIATWNRQQGVYGQRSSKAPNYNDPYQMVSERLGKEERQELFSFAAASMVDMGSTELLAMLTSQDTAARLQWLSSAVEPYMQEIQARASLASALAPPSSGAAPPQVQPRTSG